MIWGFYEIIKNLCDGRVYASRAPQNAQPPFVVFQETSSERWRDINAPAGMAQDTIQLDVYSDNNFQAKEIALQAEILLDGFRGVVFFGDDSPQSFVDFRGISRQNGGATLDQTDEPFLYRYFADYRVTYKTENE